MKCALYRHFDDSDRLLYVGIAKDPVSRQQWHMQRSSWRTQIATVTIEWFENRGLARAAEVRAISSENPVHNIHGRNPASAGGEITLMISLWHKREDFAAAVGVSLACVHRWAQRNRIPSEYLRAVVEAAQDAGHDHVTAEWLLDVLAEGTLRVGRDEVAA